METRKQKNEYCNKQSEILMKEPPWGIIKIIFNI